MNTKKSALQGLLTQSEGQEQKFADKASYSSKYINSVYSCQFLNFLRLLVKPPFCNTGVIGSVYRGIYHV